jgi:hypothetical protein
MPRVLNVDKNPAYPAAVEALNAAGALPRSCADAVTASNLNPSANAGILLILRSSSPVGDSFQPETQVRNEGFPNSSAASEFMERHRYGCTYRPRRQSR